MNHVNLLRSLPKTIRDIDARRDAKDKGVANVAKLYGRDYFDGDRKYGYGGYYYDGRWKQVAIDIINQYNCIGQHKRVLDVGCAKGFLVKDLSDYVDAYGLDISKYAVMNCPIDIAGRVHVGSADCLPFPSDSFDLVLSINTLHNLGRYDIGRALREMMRVSRTGNMFVQVDSYRDEEEKALFKDWVLTAEWTGYPDDWLQLFREADYDGDYDWTFVRG